MPESTLRALSSIAVPILSLPIALIMSSSDIKISLSEKNALKRFGSLLTNPGIAASPKADCSFCWFNKPDPNIVLIIWI